MFYIIPVSIDLEILFGMTVEYRSDTEWKKDPDRGRIVYASRKGRHYSPG